VSWSAVHRKYTVPADSPHRRLMETACSNWPAEHEPPSLWPPLRPPHRLPQWQPELEPPTFNYRPRRSAVARIAPGGLGIHRGNALTELYPPASASAIRRPLRPTRSAGLEQGYTEPASRNSSPACLVPSVETPKAVRRLVGRSWVWILSFTAIGIRAAAAELFLAYARDRRSLRLAHAFGFDCHYGVHFLS